LRGDARSVRKTKEEYLGKGAGENLPRGGAYFPGGKGGVVLRQNTKLIREVHPR